MTIKEFIEAAIEGGWRILDKRAPSFQDYEAVVDWFEAHESYAINALVLDPKAWEAVDGVLMGEKSWLDPDECVACEYPGYQNAVEAKMYGMIKFLMKGGTLEEYLETL